MCSNPDSNSVNYVCEFILLSSVVEPNTSVLISGVNLVYKSSAFFLAHRSLPHFPQPIMLEKYKCKQRSITDKKAKILTDIDKNISKSKIARMFAIKNVPS